MKLQTFSDKATKRTFTYDFLDHDAAQAGGHALMGYMIGNYAQPVIELTHNNNGQLTAVYIEDNDLIDVFNRICDSFQDFQMISTSD